MPGSDLTPSGGTGTASAPVDGEKANEGAGRATNSLLRFASSFLAMDDESRAFLPRGALVAGEPSDDVAPRRRVAAARRVELAGDEAIREQASVRLRRAPRRRSGL